MLWIILAIAVFIVCLVAQSVSEEKYFREHADEIRERHERMKALIAKTRARNAEFAKKREKWVELGILKPNP